MKESVLPKPLTRPESSKQVGAYICSTCYHWERQVHTSKRGFCPIFLKDTDASHGQQCTAYQPERK